MSTRVVDWKPGETERTVKCPRCGGVGGWTGWPGFTCYLCGGLGTRTYSRERPERRKRCLECKAMHKPSEEHWNGLYNGECPVCTVNHQRENCPRCGAPHPQRAAQEGTN